MDPKVAIFAAGALFFGLAVACGRGRDHAERQEGLSLSLASRVGRAQLRAFYWSTWLLLIWVVTQQMSAWALLIALPSTALVKESLTALWLARQDAKALGSMEWLAGAGVGTCVLAAAFDPLALPASPAEAVLLQQILMAGIAGCLAGVALLNRRAMRRGRAWALRRQPATSAPTLGREPADGPAAWPTIA